MATRSVAAEFIGALQEVWEDFGGVPKRVVIDNLKAAVTKAGRDEAILLRTGRKMVRDNSA